MTIDLLKNHIGVIVRSCSSHSYQIVSTASHPPNPILPCRVAWLILEYACPTRVFQFTIPWFSKMLQKSASGAFVAGETTA